MLDFNYNKIIDDFSEKMNYKKEKIKDILLNNDIYDHDLMNIINLIKTY
jgi:hypothetical protein